MIPTHPVSLLHEVFPADVRHYTCGQSISHYIHHGPEPVSVERSEVGHEQDDV